MRPPPWPTSPALHDSVSVESVSRKVFAASGVIFESKAFGLSSMPWMPYVEVLPDMPGNPYRARSLADDCVFIDGHSIVVLVGGTMTNGMTIERDYAVERSINTLDLTSFGYSPPEAGSEQELLLLRLLTTLGHTPP
jgi:hypothetical protein